MFDDAFTQIAALDLEQIKRKLMHPLAGEAWSLKRTDAAEAAYRRFLYLSKLFPDQMISPTADVDMFWHYHILDTRKYAADCEVVFGYFLHHYPYLGLNEEDGINLRARAGELTRELYRKVFGDPAEAPGGQGMVGNSYCGAVGGANSEGKTGADASYCGATAAKGESYCGATAAKGESYCGATAAKGESYCGATAAKGESYCGATAAKGDSDSRATAASGESYCGATAASGESYCGATTASGVGYCGKLARAA